MLRLADIQVDLGQSDHPATVITITYYHAIIIILVIIKQRGHTLITQVLISVSTITCRMPRHHLGSASWFTVKKNTARRSSLFMTALITCDYNITTCSLQLRRTTMADSSKTNKSINCCWLRLASIAHRSAHLTIGYLFHAQYLNIKMERWCPFSKSLWLGKIGLTWECLSILRRVLTDELGIFCMQ